ncbi:MAG: hypothetical protein RL015_3706 [Verrucomicrobiota bacterium]|jgi:thiamine transporter ThiT
MEAKDSAPQKPAGLWSELRAVLDLILDFSFKHFVTPRLIRLLYALSLLAAVLATLTWMFSGFSQGLLHGLFNFVTGPVAFVLYVLSARVVMELILAIFQIAEKLREK